MLELQDKAKTVRLPSFKLTPNSIFEPQPKKRDDQAETSGKSLLDQIRIPCDLNRLRIGQLPAMSDFVRSRLKRSEKTFNGLFVPGRVFAELGFQYFGPFAGHRIELLVKHLQKAKKLSGPAVFHVVTKKGKGYRMPNLSPLCFME